MQTQIVFHFMLSLLCLLSLQIDQFDRYSDIVTRKCADQNCSDVAFISKFVEKCSKYSKDLDQLNVYGQTSDDQFYITKIDNIDYMVPVSCVRNISEVLKMPYTVELGVLKSFDDYITELEKFELTDNASKNSSTPLENNENEEKKNDETLETPKADQIDPELENMYKSQPHIISSDIHNIIKENIRKIIKFMNSSSSYTYTLKYLLTQSISFYRGIVIALLTAFLWHYFMIIKKSYYRIPKSQLDNLYSARVNILEETISQLHSQLDRKNLTLTEYITKFESLKEEHNVIALEIKDLQNKFTDTQTTSTSVDHYTTRPQMLLETDISDAPGCSYRTIYKGLDTIDSDKINEDYERIKNELDILRELHADTVKQVNAFVRLLVDNRLLQNTNLQEKLVMLGKLDTNQVSSCLAKLSQLLTDDDNKLIQLINPNSDDLKIKYEDLLIKLADLENEFKQANIKKYEVEIELKAFKNHYREAEVQLHEKCNKEKMKVAELEKQLLTSQSDTSRLPDLNKIIADLKFEISTLELKNQNIKDKHLLELNQQYTAIKKLERELDRTKVEKEKYRTQLLKVLNDNQLFQNEKTNVPESSFHRRSSNQSFRNSASPIQSNFNRGESESHEMYVPPPPPPPMPVLFPTASFPHPSFLPNETSSPQMELPSFYAQGNTHSAPYKRYNQGNINNSNNSSSHNFE